jgi:hypothetical protein
MANLHITELFDIAGPMQIPQMPPVVEQTPLAIAGASAASVAFSARTRFICLTPKADCHVAVGDTPVATANSKPLTAGQAYYFGVSPGHKVAVIAAS